MYSGIIEEIGTVKHYSSTGLTIGANQVLDDLAIKDSIAVDGVCLTVTELGDSWFRVDTMPETLRRTNLGSLPLGAKVNLAENGYEALEELENSARNYKQIEPAPSLFDPGNIDKMEVLKEPNN